MSNKALLEQSLRALRHLTQAYDDAMFGAGLCANEILDVTDATKALEAALAAPEVEPVAWFVKTPYGPILEIHERMSDEAKSRWAPLYGSSQPALKPLSHIEVQAVIDGLTDIDGGDFKEVQIKPLSDEEITAINNDHGAFGFDHIAFARALLAKAGEK